jgi:methionyl-tRNA formyltransferase
MPASAVDRHIRACTPAPGAWTTFRGERLKIHPVTVPIPGPEARDSPGVPDTQRDEVVTLGEAVAPGAVLSSKHTVQVGTASGSIRLGMVQPQGKKPMAAADWARGVRIEPGEVLGDE